MLTRLADEEEVGEGEKRGTERGGRDSEVFKSSRSSLGHAMLLERANRFGQLSIRTEARSARERGSKRCALTM